MSIFHKTEKFDYFKAFSKLAAEAYAAAVLLHDTFRSFQYESLEDYVKSIHGIENRADSVKHDIVRHLAHEFIAPIEREDIVTLAQNLDSVVDALDEVLRRIYMFDVQRIRPEALEFTKLIVSCCAALQEAVTEFPRFKSSKTVPEKLIRVNTFENRGDELHLAYLHRLFHEGSEAKLCMAWLSVYETLEQCCDACEDVADAMECIIMKNT